MFPFKIAILKSELLKYSLKSMQIRKLVNIFTYIKSIVGQIVLTVVFTILVVICVYVYSNYEKVSAKLSDFWVVDVKLWRWRMFREIKNFFEQFRWLFPEAEQSLKWDPDFGVIPPDARYPLYPVTPKKDKNTSVMPLSIFKRPISFKQVIWRGISWVFFAWRVFHAILYAYFYFVYELI